MIPIEKGPAPEQLIDELSQIEKSGNARAVSWSGISCKQEVLAALIQDQRGLCAYCMRRIGAENSHVEHIEPQSVTSEGGGTFPTRICSRSVRVSTVVGVLAQRATTLAATCP